MAARRTAPERCERSSFSSSPPTTPSSSSSSIYPLLYVEALVARRLSLPTTHSLATPKLDHSYHPHSMAPKTRRPKPSPLLLAQGPTPPRGAPKHRMPTRPAPTAVSVSGSPPSSPNANWQCNSTTVKQRSRTLSVTVPPPAARGTTTNPAVPMRPREIRAPWDIGLAFGEAIPAQSIQLAQPPRAAVAGFSSAFLIARY